MINRRPARLVALSADPPWSRPSRVASDAAYAVAPDLLTRFVMARPGAQPREWIEERALPLFIASEHRADVAIAVTDPAGRIEASTDGLVALFGAPTRDDMPVVCTTFDLHEPVSRTLVERFAWPRLLAGYGSIAWPLLRDQPRPVLGMFLPVRDRGRIPPLSAAWPSSSRAWPGPREGAGVRGRLAILVALSPTPRPLLSFPSFLSYRDSSQRAGTFLHFSTPGSDSLRRLPSLLDTRINFLSENTAERRRGAVHLVQPAEGGGRQVPDVARRGEQTSDRPRRTSARSPPTPRRFAEAVAGPLRSHSPHRIFPGRILAVRTSLHERNERTKEAPLPGL